MKPDECVNTTTAEDYSLVGSLAKRSPVNVEFHDVTYCVSNGKGTKILLNGVSGEFRAGELAAIMGPSGAGKSSLMNILAGFEGVKVDGNIYVNGSIRNRKTFRKLSCYIMQTDELCPYLDVNEAMWLAANLKIGNEMSKNEKKSVINEILVTIGLDQSTDTRTDRLSGGQKKRLAIALEMVNNPPVMFLDEPTSGLDSSSCSQCVSILKSLAMGGRTIVTVIHQPSSSVFEMFDHLYMLAEGRCIYQGYPSGLVDFLSSNLGLYCPSTHNPADFDVASGKYGYVIDKMANANQRASLSDSSSLSKASSRSDSPSKDTEVTVVCESFSSTVESEDGSGIAQAYPAAGFWTQFTLLFRRAFLATMRDLTLTHLKVACHVIVGIVVGLLYFNVGDEATKVFNNLGHVYFDQLFLMFTALMATVLTFPLEMPILVREHLNNWYTLKAYYLSRTVADLPFQIAYPFIYIVIVYFMTGQPMETSRFLMYLLMGIMGSLVAQSVGLLIGIIFPLETAVFMAPVSMAPLLLFSGYFVTFGTIPGYLRWLCYTVYTRFSFEGSLASIYDFGRPKLNCLAPYCQFKSSTRVLEEFDITLGVYWIDLIALVAYFFIVRALAYAILRIKICSRYK